MTIVGRQTKKGRVHQSVFWHLLLYLLFILLPFFNLIVKARRSSLPRRELARLCDRLGSWSPGPGFSQLPAQEAEWEERAWRPWGRGCSTNGYWSLLPPRSSPGCGRGARLRPEDPALGPAGTSQSGGVALARRGCWGFARASRRPRLGTRNLGQAGTRPRGRARWADAGAAEPNRPCPGRPFAVRTGGCPLLRGTEAGRLPPFVIFRDSPSQQCPVSPRFLELR
ncbi:uncharacterized protein LOC104004828 [Pan troglodytes]|uniref:uncharacterized protein LOC104004828 n=1 Tax=Pan troglodytes TaxID=9598 RepID=UPI0007DB9152|nr:uncharacterized protein LOC104004828 [Pan troglodytes]XP_054531094.1 uncharacterized protein LOC104004828 [Pan troglodytes]